MVSELRKRFSAEISRISSLFLTSTPSFSDSRRFHGRNLLNFSQIVRNSIEINPRKFQIKIQSFSGSKLDLRMWTARSDYPWTAHPDGWEPLIRTIWSWTAPNSLLWIAYSDLFGSLIRITSWIAYLDQFLNRLFNQSKIAYSVGSFLDRLFRQFLDRLFVIRFAYLDRLFGKIIVWFAFLVTPGSRISQQIRIGF